MIDTWIKGPEYFASLGPTALTFNVLLAICAVVGIVVRRGTVQAIIAVGQLVYVLRQAILIG
jgi:hypothetical protein